MKMGYKRLWYWNFFFFERILGKKKELRTHSNECMQIVWNKRKSVETFSTLRITRDNKIYKRHDEILKIIHVFIGVFFLSLFFPFPLVFFFNFQVPLEDFSEPKIRNFLKVVEATMGRKIPARSANRKKLHKRKKKN